MAKPRFTGQARWGGSFLFINVSVEEEIDTAGVKWYRLSEEEINSSIGKIVVDSSETADSDSSSDGVPKDLQQDVVHEA